MPPAKKSTTAKKTARKNGKKAVNREAPSTPAARRGGPPTVAVFGAGIAGLTAAHELAERGFKVTVHEAAADDRRRAGAPKESVPPVRLGGMAATQFVSDDELRPFPEVQTSTRASAPVVGEHGFRFFPAYYLHIYDTLRRIPVYDDDDNETERTVYDNVGGSSRKRAPHRTAGRRSCTPRGAANTARSAWFVPGNDAGRQHAVRSRHFYERMVRYLVTSPLRREDELEEISTYDYFRGLDVNTGQHQFHYSDAFDDQLQRMPRILAAFDSRRGDARTNLNTFIQLNMLLDRYDTKADGVLNGPTTIAWFDHWYTYLTTKLGVTFERATFEELRPRRRPRPGSRADGEHRDEGPSSRRSRRRQTRRALRGSGLLRRRDRRVPRRARDTTSPRPSDRRPSRRSRAPVLPRDRAARPRAAACANACAV